MRTPRKCRRLGYCAHDEPTLLEAFHDADDRLLNRIVNNPEHLLHPFLTDREQNYNLRQRPYGNKTLLEKHHHSTTRISSSELCTDTVTNPHSMTQPLLSTYSKLLLTLHIHFFQFHVLYAAYVGYLIKRIWYGCCFIGYFSRSFFVLSFTLNTVGRLVTFPYEVSFESPSLQIRG